MKTEEKKIGRKRNDRQAGASTVPQARRREGAREFREQIWDRLLNAMISRCVTARWIERLDGEGSKERRLRSVHARIWKKENCSRRVLAFEVFLLGRRKQAWRYSATRRAIL